MMSGYPGYQQDTTQLVKTKWPYLEAKNYANWDSLVEGFPHLKLVNTHHAV